jgi:hypothetical protein
MFAISVTKLESLAIPKNEIDKKLVRSIEEGFSRLHRVFASPTSFVLPYNKISKLPNPIVVDENFAENIGDGKLELPKLCWSAIRI